MRSDKIGVAAMIYFDCFKLNRRCIEIEREVFFCLEECFILQMLYTESIHIWSTPLYDSLNAIVS